MTDLDTERISDVRRTQRAVDLEFFRQELQAERQFRLDQLTKLADEATTITNRALPSAGFYLRCEYTDESRKDRRQAKSDIVDVWGRDSFPASDPPANW
jgi:hypothetical protein